MSSSIYFIAVKILVYFYRLVGSETSKFLTEKSKSGTPTAHLELLVLMIQKKDESLLVTLPVA